MKVKVAQSCLTLFDPMDYHFRSYYSTFQYIHLLIHKVHMKRATSVQ